MRLPSIRSWPVAFDIYALAVITTTLLIATLDYAYPRMLHIADQDGIANLNVGRFLTDSLTPGFSQVGTWNLLNHMLLAPVAAFDFWYWTGTAGFIVHLPLFFLAAYCIYRTCIEITGDRFGAFFGAIIFSLNPYVLQMFVSPMSEPSFITLLAAISMFVAQWIRQRSMSHLMGAAACISLACIARFEAFALVPGMLTIVFWRMFLWKHSWSHIFSTLLIFFLLSATGIVFVILYSWFYTGSPFFFVTYSPTSEAFTAVVEETRKQTDFLSINPGRLRQLPSVFVATLIILYSRSTLVVCGCGILWFFVSKQRWNFLMTILILLAPTAFIVLAYITGKRNFVAGEFVTTLVNIRFFLHMIVVLSILSGCAIATFKVSTWKSVQFLGRVFALVAVATSAVFMLNTFFVSEFPGVTRIDAYSGRHLQSVTSLRSLYDYGNVLMSHSDNETYIYNSYFSLRRIIYESNYQYFDQALRDPWLFARWVVTGADTAGHDQVTLLIFKYVPKEVFLVYYEPVFITRGRRIYRLREDVVREVATKLGYDPSLIPSLNPEARWNPSTFYEEIEAEKIR